MLPLYVITIQLHQVNEKDENGGAESRIILVDKSGGCADLLTTTSKLWDEEEKYYDDDDEVLWALITPALIRRYFCEWRK